ncbi:MAG TPA: choice-of-anchor L domain-containing protein [Edaphocola sp.]|nr:choice-of-anchor L domain-containing protein [Edaphocola sp.]
MRVITTKICASIMLSLLMLMASKAKAQLTIDDNVTAAQLVQKLVGTGVITMNPTVTCKTLCSATFEGTSNLGIDSGILLVTGLAKTNGGLIGVNATAGQSMSSQTTGPGDTDLSAMLAGSPSTVTNNACVLQFDFVPAGDTIKFQYVFGSEEYPEYACTSFNDVFGFLISGPGIVSNIPSLPTKRNIALVPGTTNIPVAINSINSGVGGGSVSTCSNQYPGAPYTQYYVNNATGTTVVFDGFTTVLTAIQNVTPCDTYHLKLAIADVADGALNSGVFIKAGSLSSPAITTSASGMDTLSQLQIKDTAYTVRGCPPATITVSRPNASATPLVVPYDLFGTAVNGVDYQFLSGNVTIPANALTAQIVVKGLPLVNPGPNKTCIVKIKSPYNCGNNNDYLDSSVVIIQDSILLSSSVLDTGLCFGQQLEVVFDVDTIFGDLDYEWVPNSPNINSNSIDFSSISFPTPGDYQYQYKVRIPSLDTNCRASTVTLNVRVDDIKVNIGDDSAICSYNNLQMFAEVFPQDTGGSYQYSWEPANIFNNPTSVAPMILAGASSANVIVTVQTDIGCTGKDTMVLTVNPGEFIDLTPKDTAICPGVTVVPNVYSTLSNTPLNPNYQYAWTPEYWVSNPNIKNPGLTPETDTKFRLIAKNEFGCYDTSFVNMIVHPAATLSLPDSVIMWLGESYQLNPYTNALFFNWFPVSGISNANVSNPVFTPIKDTRYFVTATTDEGCTLRDSIDFRINEEGVVDMPNAFNPNTTTLKPVYRGNFNLLSFEVYNRWGNQVFQSKDINNGWDGKISGTPAPLGVYVYDIQLEEKNTGKKVRKTGNVTLLR